MARSLKINSLTEKNEILNYLKTKTYPQESSESQKKLIRRKSQNLVCKNDTIYYLEEAGEVTRIRRIFYDFALHEKEDFILWIHSSAHIGVKKTFRKIQELAINIKRAEIQSVIKNCISCQTQNPLMTVTDIKPIKVTRKFERFQLDLVNLEEYKESNEGFCYILNVIDCFSKYLWSFPLKSKKAENINSALQNIFLRFGPPFCLHSDNGKEFKNQLISSLCNKWKIKQIFGRARHPQSQGQIERLNQTIKRFLSRSLNLTQEKMWSRILDEVVYEYNTTFHRATGSTPIKILLGTKGYNCEEEANYNLDYDEKDFHTLEDDDFESSKEFDNLLQDDYEDMREYNNKYISETIKFKNRNNLLSFYEIGQEVLIKKDFDNNVKTKKRTFDGYFEEQVYKIVKISDFFLTLSDEKGNLSVVDKARTKVLNKKY